MRRPIDGMAIHLGAFGRCIIRDPSCLSTRSRTGRVVHRGKWYPGGFVQSMASQEGALEEDRRLRVWYNREEAFKVLYLSNKSVEDVLWLQRVGTVADEWWSERVADGCGGRDKAVGSQLRRLRVDGRDRQPTNMESRGLERQLAKLQESDA